MNKSDKIFTSIIIVVTILLYFFSSSIFNALSGDYLVAVVYRHDKEYARLNMDEDQEIVVPGDLGDVVVEVRNKKVRIKTETSPLHICSIMGWADKAHMTLTCLPNSVYIIIENGKKTAPGQWDLDGSIK